MLYRNESAGGGTESKLWSDLPGARRSNNVYALDLDWQEQLRLSISCVV